MVYNKLFVCQFAEGRTKLTMGYIEEAAALEKPTLNLKHFPRETPIQRKMSTERKTEKATEDEKAQAGKAQSNTERF